MRLKDLWYWMPLGYNLRLIWARITLTKFTAAFVIISVIHCVAQVVLGTVALSHDLRANEFVKDLLADAQQPPQIAILDGQGMLWLCENIPDMPGSKPCKLTVDAMMNVTSAKRHLKRDEKVSSTFGRLEVDIVFDQSNSPQGGVVSGLAMGDNVISMTCIGSMAWARQVLRQAKREVLSIIGFQFWLLVLSIIGVLNESTPHILASLASHMLATGWSIFSIFRTHKLEELFERTIAQGTCLGVDLLPGFWRTRMLFEFPITVLNCAVLIAVSYLSWTLVKVFGWQSFKRVGASWKLNQLYKIVLVLTVSMHLTTFFLLTSTALWIDELCTGVIHGLARHIRLYQAAFFITIIVAAPWLVMGWISVRRESKNALLAFLIISVAIITIWTTMFASPLYRWTFDIWPFFATMTVAAYVLMVATFILGIICRINFGQGLSQYLRASEDVEQDAASFEPVLVPADKLQLDADEKGTFPPAKDALQTYASAFGTGPAKPGKVRFAPDVKQARRNFSFYPNHFEDFEPPLTEPEEAHRKGHKRKESSISGHKRSGSHTRPESRFSLTPESGPPSWLRSARGLSMISRGVGVAKPGKPGLPTNPRSKNAF